MEWFIPSLSHNGIPPSKGDWTEQVKEDLMDFNISSSFELIVSKSVEVFKNLVKIRAK